jgi:hypothetical protein
MATDEQIDMHSDGTKIFEVMPNRFKTDLESC